MESSTHQMEQVNQSLKSSRSEQTEVMIVSRGRGRGHAMPDIAIAEALTNMVPELHIRFISYSAGAEAYRAHGYQVLDLQKSDNPPFLDMVIEYTRLLGQAKIDLVVAHEEIPVLPAAKALKIPCVFMTDYFEDPGQFTTSVLRYAEEIVFLAPEGLYTEPPYLRGKVSYVGNAVRQFRYRRTDRGRARCELDIPHDAIVILCQPGGWTESRMPLADLLCAAWDCVACSPKCLIWIAGRDYEMLTARFHGRADIRVLKEDWKIDRLMVASDMLITKATRTTVYEAASIGVPSISISNFLNWPDDVAVARVPSNTALFAESVTPEALAQLILKRKCGDPLPAPEHYAGVTGAATRITYHLDQIHSRANRRGDDMALPSNQDQCSLNR